MRMNHAFLSSLVVLTSISLAASAAAPKTNAVQSKPPTTTAAIQQPLSGQVNTVALHAADYLALQVTPQSKQEQMQTFALSIQNKQAKHLELMQIEVINGLSEQVVQQARVVQQQRAAAKRQTTSGLLRSVTSMGSSLIPSSGGIGGALTSQGLSQASSMAANMIESGGTAKAEPAANYTGQIIQRTNNILISPKQTFQCLAVVPEGQTPIVKIIFKDLQTNQIMEIQK